jgi:pantothenate kinase
VAPVTRAPVEILRSDRDALLSRAHAMAAPGTRRLLGITGAPGAGKSTLADELVAGLGDLAVLVPMDGFHLAEVELHRVGRHDRKGAPDTFDAGGYLALLRRLRACNEPIVYAPTFRRDLEEPIAGALAVPRTVPLVVTEGNYLLVEDGDWRHVGALLDEVWYVDPPEDERLRRLLERHISFGRDAAAARERTHGSDQRNADLVVTTKQRADVVVLG